MFKLNKGQPLIRSNMCVENNDQKSTAMPFVFNAMLLIQFLNLN